MSVDHAALTHILERIGSFSQVVWDFDGVLAETEAFHQESYRRVALTRAFEPEGDWYTPLIGNTAAENWRSLVDSGLAATEAEIPTLESERERVFASLSGDGLPLSGIGAILIPAFTASGTKQEVISNGDLTLIRASIKRWGYDHVLQLVHRNPAEDKRALLQARARPAVITFDDTDRYLRAAEAAGALAVGVRHAHNAHSKLTNLVLPINVSHVTAQPSRIPPQPVRHTQESGVAAAASIAERGSS